MDIRQIDPADEPTLRESYDLERKAMLEGRPDASHWSWSEMRGQWQRPDPGEDARLYGGWVEGRMVAGAVLYMGLTDNVEKAWLGVAVRPEHQGAGHGRALLAHVEEVARAQGRTELLAESKVPSDAVDDHRHRRFAEAAGYRYSNVEVVRHLPLPVPAASLDDWAAQAAERHDGYTIETHVNGVSDDRLESLLELQSLLGVDAPTGEADFEQEVITPDRFRANMESLVAAGRTIYETVAVAPDGVVAAQTTISAPPAPRTDASQWGTFVHRGHRGRRLGLAVKAANLRAVQEAHPALRRVVTQNAETNQWMIAINEQMGFAAVEASLEFLKRV